MPTLFDLDYSKVHPKFWTVKPARRWREGAPSPFVVALYLMTSPHSNMLGPVLPAGPVHGGGNRAFSGRGFGGASRLHRRGLLPVRPATKMVWVVEMASYQIGSALLASDKRCKGIQKDYAALPNCPFLGEFFDRYAAASTC
jgi:hypothetical protein